MRVLDDSASFDEWLGSYLSTPLRIRLRRPKPFFLQTLSEPESELSDEEDFDDETDGDADECENYFNLQSQSRSFMHV